MKPDIREVRYSIDRVRINSRLKVNTLRAALPLEAIRNHSKSASVDYPSSAAKKGYYHSKIELVAPGETALMHVAKLTDKYKKKPSKLFKISYLEICRDTVFNTTSDAEFEAKIRGSMVLKRWSNKIRLFDNMDKPISYFEARKGKGYMYGNETLALGRKKFPYVIYPRYSKFNKMPCCHEEWRLVGATQIKLSANISELSDLLAFDCENFFKTQEEKYLRYAIIDEVELGKLLLGWTSMRKLNDRQEREAKFQGNAYCKAKDLAYVAKLINHLSDIKDQAKSRGRRSEIENRVLKLKSFNKFLIPCTYEKAVDRLYPARKLLLSRLKSTE